MFEATGAQLRPDYGSLKNQLHSLLSGETDFISNAAQFSAFIYQTVADLNWAGFYLVKLTQNGTDQQLLVGPYQGKVACARIPFSKGVCGAAATQKCTFLVPDVHAFPGHIACDSASNSEIVIPVIKDRVLLGVFDIDSPSLNRFLPEDQIGLEQLVEIFVQSVVL